MGYEIKQGQTAQPLVFLMVDSTDHLTGKTGLTPTVKISKNGAAGVSPSGAVSEIDATNMPGWYKVAGNATDTNTLGPLLLHASAAGADPVDDRYEVVAYDPQAASQGLSLAKTTNITGFNDIAATAIVSNGAITTASGKVSGVALVDVCTTNTDMRGTDSAYTGTPPTVAQVRAEMDANSTKLAFLTGDSFARIGAAGAGLTALGDARLAKLDANVSTRMATFTYTVPPTVVQIRTEMDSNSAKLANLDAAVSSRSVYAGGAVASVTAPVTVGTNNDKTGYSISGTKTTLDALRDFNPAADVVAHVTLVDTTTTNTDMRGTDGAAKAGDAMTLNLTQAVPTTNTAQTIGDALNAARADGFGKWAKSGTTLTLYAADGTTAVRTFTLDDSDAPNSRT